MIFDAIGHRVDQALGNAALWQLMATAALIGALTGLALPPFNLWLCAIFGLAASLRLLGACVTGKQAALIGWAYGTGYFAVCLHWIVAPFSVDAARYLWMAPFALVFMATGMAVFWGAAFWGAHKLSNGSGWCAKAMAWATCLGLAELLRSYVLTGFPWALLSQIWVQTETLQWLSVIGPHGLVFLTLIAIGLPVAALSRPRTLTVVISLVPAVVLALAPHIWSASSETTAPTNRIVRLVQPNAPQREKWNPDMIPVFFQRQIGFTNAPGPSGRRPDLIVWPETAVPTLLNHADEVLQVIAQAAQGSPVALGIERRDGPKLYNSMILLDANGQISATYDKFHLVPFGEYIPLGGLLGRLGLHGMDAEDGDGFSAGPGPRLVDVGPLGNALPLICYEAVFPQDVNRAPQRPDFLLQITNDAWFGQFSGPYQHLAQARMRAIEQGVPMVRVANTGVSAMIDAQGRITAQIALGVAGFIDADLPRSAPPTPYSCTGDLPITLALLMALAGLTLFKLRRVTPK
jgi:apolipoprotein N-acyltransferase